MVLAISYLVTSILYFLINSAVYHQIHRVWIIPFGITTAIAGWLTDAFIGRYRVIRCSIWIMWLLMIAVTVSAVVGQLNEIYHHYDKDIIQALLFCLTSIGLGAFQANIIQFGLDQLHDASTNEIRSFIVWYVNCPMNTSLPKDTTLIEYHIYCHSHSKLELDHSFSHICRGGSRISWGEVHCLGAHARKYWTMPIFGKPRPQTGSE